MKVHLQILHLMGLRKTMMVWMGLHRKIEEIHRLLHDRQSHLRSHLHFLHDLHRIHHHHQIHRKMGHRMNLKVFQNHRPHHHRRHQRLELRTKMREVSMNFQEVELENKYIKSDIQNMLRLKDHLIDSIYLPSRFTSSPDETPLAKRKMARLTF